MAEKPLRSVKFPGLPNTYTIPQGGGGASGVSSVNGKTGDVTLTQDDIPAGESYARFSQEDKKKLDETAPSETTPKEPGTAAAGTETAYSRGDHVHPSDTSKLGTNGDASNVTAAFTQNASRVNLVSGETLAALFGKLMKWLADLGTLAFKSSVAKSDLASDVQTSLGKADTALQTETDPTVPAWAKTPNKPTYTSSEVGALPNTTEIPQPASVAPKSPGTAAAGSSSDYARADHVHPRELPTVSASDNGKFLRVVSGAWAAATVDSANGGNF